MDDNQPDPSNHVYSSVGTEAPLEADLETVHPFSSISTSASEIPTVDDSSIPIPHPVIPAPSEAHIIGDDGDEEGNEVDPAVPANGAAVDISEAVFALPVPPTAQPMTWANFVHPITLVQVRPVTEGGEAAAPHRDALDEVTLDNLLRKATTVRILATIGVVASIFYLFLSSVLYVAFGIIFAIVCCCGHYGALHFIRRCLILYAAGLGINVIIRVAWIFSAASLS
eukprot:TRINITY_DN19107_c0_g1::TRINITY_DN19107_c0_g1_i1::g.13841::m.13841 TRINITY_DN19107_c0_g1::TRINITY_DN19107_c0_g1_i1::g.13841  ORF type:complete len:226 (+),score=16.03 TRINITY_DN19107_c0_g1_i1:95-772(+)